MQILAELTIFLNTKRRKQRTIEIHRDNFKRLLNASPRLKKSEILEFLFNLQRNGRKGTYLNHYVDVLRLYGQWKNKKEYKNFPYFKEEPFIKATLSDEESVFILEDTQGAGAPLLASFIYQKDFY